MKNVLICSIFRDSEKSFTTYKEQLKKLCDIVKSEYSVYLSWYENDSVDLTPTLLSVSQFTLIEYQGYLETPFLKGIVYNSEKLNTNKYGSIWNLERIINLANARNKAVEQGLNKWKDIKFDKIIFIEPDIEYDPIWCSELILARHPSLAGINPDVYSGWALRSNKHPKESMFAFDTTSLRATKNDIHWDFENENRWKNESLIKTHITDIDSNCLHTVYSTFNCFCAYNAEIFYGGIRFGTTNERVNPSNIKINNGYLDSDTVVILEEARKNGYNNVLLNRNCIVRHL